MQKLNDNVIFDIMKSFVSGDSSYLLPELLPFMNTTECEEIRWIPRHMEYFLEKFANNSTISPWIRAMLKGISSQFIAFESCDKSDGRAWEKLFTIGILIRLLGGEFHDTLMPFKKIKYEVSFNLNDACIDLNDCHHIEEVKARLRRNFKTYPHIAVIAPPFLRFEKYDLFIVIFESSDLEPEIYAYQCKLEDESANNKSVDKTVTKTFWINGTPP